MSFAAATYPLVQLHHLPRGQEAAGLETVEVDAGRRVGLTVVLQSREQVSDFVKNCGLRALES